MRVACVNSSSNNRDALKDVLETAYRACKSTIGHIPLADIYTASREQAVINHPPNVFAVGSGASVDDAYLTCKTIRRQHPNVPIFVFVESENYNFRNLQRFKGLADDVFCLGADPERLVYRLSVCASTRQADNPGKLIVVCGVKGGVGATTVVSGLAHACHAIGKSSLTMDLSTKANFGIYMGSERLQSTDYKNALVKHQTPDFSLLEHCITTAPNGISILLPPADGTAGAAVGSKVRDLWLRNPDSVDVTLSLVELAREWYDAIFVDIGGAEGLLPYALLANADRRVLVSSNDPASVHVLAKELTPLLQLSGEGYTQILLNELLQTGITKDEVIDFISTSSEFDDFTMSLAPLPYDQHGARWIGTGNSFYTESKPEVQRLLERSMQSLLLSREELLTRQSDVFNPLAHIRGYFSSRKKKTQKSLPLIRALPEKLFGSSFADVGALKPGAPDLLTENKQLLRPSLALTNEALKQNVFALPAHQVNDNDLYTAPMPVGEAEVDDLGAGLNGTLRHG